MRTQNKLDSSSYHFWLVERDEAVVLLVHVEVFDEAAGEEVVEAHFPALQQGEVGRCDPRDAVVADDEGAADAPAVRGDIAAAFHEVNADVGAHAAGPAEEAEGMREHRGPLMHAEDATVEEDYG